MSYSSENGSLLNGWPVQQRLHPYSRSQRSNADYTSQLDLNGIENMQNTANTAGNAEITLIPTHGPLSPEFLNMNLGFDSFNIQCDIDWSTYSPYFNMSLWNEKGCALENSSKLFLQSNFPQDTAPINPYSQNRYSNATLQLGLNDIYADGIRFLVNRPELITGSSTMENTEQKRKISDKNWAAEQTPQKKIFTMDDVNSWLFNQNLDSPFPGGNVVIC
jgi:hypothetical protein